MTSMQLSRECINPIQQWPRSRQVCNLEITQVMAMEADHLIRSVAMESVPRGSFVRGGYLATRPNERKLATEHPRLRVPMQVSCTSIDINWRLAEIPSKFRCHIQPQ